jgi:hypothetical protein
MTSLWFLTRICLGQCGISRLTGSHTRGVRRLFNGVMRCFLNLDKSGLSVNLSATERLLHKIYHSFAFGSDLKYTCAVPHEDEKPYENRIANIMNSTLTNSMEWVFFRNASFGEVSQII